MDVKVKIIGLLLLFTGLLPGCHPKQTIERKGDLTILHLSGTAYQQGFAHGNLMKREISEILSRWKNEVELAWQADFESVVTRFFETTGYVNDITLQCPDLLDEIRGIADGSGFEYETILAFQLSEEIDVLSGESGGKHCTSLSINRKSHNPTWLAQNMDPPQFLHGFPTLLHLTDKESGIENYVYTIPGLIGLTGMNSAGIGITCNSLSMLNHSDRGLPVAFIVRTVLQQPGETEAFRFIETVPIGIPQCFTVGGPGEARCYECSVNRKSIFRPFAQQNITLHTNFAAINRDFNNRYINLLQEYGKSVDEPYFCPRYYLAYDKVVENDFHLDYASMRSILSLTEPEIQPISGEDTYGCLIMELSENPVLHIAPGKPDRTEFIRVTF